MKSVRWWVRNCTETHGVHPRLIANFDQVCTTHFEHAKKGLFKHSSKRGQLADPLSLKPSTKLILSKLHQAMNCPQLQEEQSDDVKPYEPKKPELNAEGHICNVEYYRLARTTTTLSWNDGTMGAAYVTARSSNMPQKVVDEINSELKGVSG